MRIAWHSSRWWGWCLDEDQKKETEKLWAWIYGFLCLVTGYKNFFNQQRPQIKMSSLLNVSNNSSNSEEINPKDINVLVNNKGQNWFKIGIYRTISRDSPYHNINHQVIRRGYKILDLPPSWGRSVARTLLGKTPNIMIYSSRLLVPFMSL